jgi:hypothetical protein
MIRTILLFSWLTFHPVHVTFISIDFSREMGSFNVFLKMYYDDFLLDSKINNDSGKSNYSGDISQSRPFVNDYINKKLMIYADQKKLLLEIGEIKLNDNELYLNISNKSIGKPKSITVKNMIMTDLYSDQANMMIVKTDDFEEGFKLTPVITEKTFKVK